MSILRRPRPSPALSAHAPLSRPALIADDPPYLSFHLWMLVALASAFAMFVAWKSGGLAFVVINDSTYISEAILLFFWSTTLYCGRRAFRLSRELLAVQQFAGLPLAADALAPAQASQTWSSQVLARHANPQDERAQWLESLEEKILGPHDVGWFITESLTKLGLLGTVVGFLIMLTALIGSNQLELSAMQMILRDMASGMGIKIIATVVGLLCNMVLALQWLLLDRCAQKILSAARLQMSLGQRIPEPFPQGLRPQAS